MSHDTVSFPWNSRASGTISCYEDDKQTIEMDLDGKDLMLIAKKRISDDDDDAVFILTLGNGLTLQNITPVKYKVDYLILPEYTVELPRTKNTTLWVELIGDPNDPLYRQRIEQFPMTVEPSVKEATT